MPTTTSIRKIPREKQINIRATDEERAVIDYALAWSIRTVLISSLNWLTEPV